MGLSSKKALGNPQNMWQCPLNEGFNCIAKDGALICALGWDGAIRYAVLDPHELCGVHCSDAKFLKIMVLQFGSHVFAYAMLYYAVPCCTKELSKM